MTNGHIASPFLEPRALVFIVPLPLSNGGAGEQVEEGVATDDSSAPPSAASNAAPTCDSGSGVTTTSGKMFVTELQYTFPRGMKLNLPSHQILTIYFLNPILTCASNPR